MLKFLQSTSYQPFLDQIFMDLQEHQMDVSNYYLDHICYRVADENTYGIYKENLLKQHELIAESEVNGRPIANFRLSEPIIYENRIIEVLELPAPKKGSNYKEGYEHVEFVIDRPIEEFVGQWHKVKFDLNGMNKPFNREVRLHLRQGSVKFHEQSLEEVIKAERENLC